MMSNELTVLFAPGSGSGAMKTSRAVAEELTRRGHRVVFAVDKKFKGQLEKYGYEEVLHSVPELEQPTDAEVWQQFVWKNSEALKGNPMEIIEGFVVKRFEKQLAENKALDKHYRSIIAVIKPDVIVVDSFVCSPALTNSGIPWVYLFSGAPLYLLDDLELPPPFSGFQMKGGITDKWRDFHQKLTEKTSHVLKDLNKWCQSVGAPELSANRFLLHPYSPYLNMYIIPKELDYYSTQRHLPYNWKRVECLLSEADSNEQDFKLPDNLLKSNRKLVLVNMGSIGTADVELMRKLVAKLSYSEHMFIIITGVNHGKYELADNMWGQPSLPMPKVLPKVDLVIHSGSYYSVCEALRFGKPTIILPLYGDQIETAQRVREVNYGLTLNPYTCSLPALIASIDALLGDPFVTKRAFLVSDRLKKLNDKSKAVDFIEKILNNKV